jgi:bifunctional non-homologous end joining protein LigD
MTKTDIRSSAEDQGTDGSAAGSCLLQRSGLASSVSARREVSAPLPYRRGSSDKVYQAAVEECPGGGFVVRFAYGRRGSTLKTGTKTPNSVPLAEALRVFDKLVASKLAKGYTAAPGGEPYRATPYEARDTGSRCQLANPVSEAGAEALVADECFCMQEKFDGRRMLVRKSAEGETTGVNRRGLAVALPAAVADAAARLPGSFVIDGEAIGDTLRAFDLLERDGLDLRKTPCIDRLSELEDLLHDGDGESIRLVPTAFDTREKKRMLAELRERHAEGAVFKQTRSLYRSGRPASGGDWLKFKFLETASFIVASVHPKRRSVALELSRGPSERVPAGNVAIPPNHPVPRPGSVVEVLYLHAFPESGAVFQPVFLGCRDDIPPEDCTPAQLKYKPAEPGAPAPERRTA